MDTDAPPAPTPTSGSAAPLQPCVFARALLAQAASCTLARRRSIGEREAVACPSPVAHANCDTLAALMHERARFALRLPAPDTPLMHAQAMRLQCGGLAGLRQALGAAATDRAPAVAAAATAPDPAPPAAALPDVLHDAPPDVHALVGLAQRRHGSLTALPWASIVAAMRAWAPRRRHAPKAP